MSRKLIQAHSGLVIVHPSSRDEVVLSGYDGGYPPMLYRSKPNLLGGNPEALERHLGTREVLEREVAEELDRGKKEVDWKNRPITWASLDDICLIRNAILTNIRPYKDFVMDVAKQDGAYRGGGFSALQSVYSAQIPDDVLECIRDNVRHGRRMATEGFLGIHFLHQLAVAGEYSTSHATAPILSDYFGIQIPSPEWMSIAQVSGPRATFKDYESEFEYGEKVFRVQDGK